MNMISMIIPIYGEIKDNNLQHCINSLIVQTFKDFEIIIVGNKIIQEPEKIINGIKLKNIIINTNRLGKLANEGIKESEGEYVHIWNSDLIIYPNYLERLNQYISEYGSDNLYAGRLIDMRSVPNNQYDNFYFKSSYSPEGSWCIHKKYFEPFREEFEGFATHWGQELCLRLWKKMKFICMQDVEIVHLPHPMRISYEESVISSEKSWELFQRIKEE